MAKNDWASGAPPNINQQPKRELARLFLSDQENFELYVGDMFLIILRLRIKNLSLQTQARPPYRRSVKH